MPGQSILDYARFHDLASPLDNEYLLAKLDNIPLISGADETSLPFIEISNSVSCLQETKLQVSGVAINLLNQCMQHPHVALGNSKLCDNPRLLKMDLPLLRSDPLKDVEWFRRKINLDKLLGRCIKHGPHQVHASQGVSNTLKKSTAALNELNQAIRNERLAVSKEVIVALGSHITDSWSPGDTDEAFQCELSCGKPLSMARVFADDVCLPLSHVEMPVSGEESQEDLSLGQAQSCPSPMIDEGPTGKCEGLDGLIADTTIDFSIDDCENKLRLEIPRLQNEISLLKNCSLSNQSQQLLTDHLSQWAIFSFGDSHPDETTLNWSPIPRQVILKELREEIESTCIPSNIATKPDCAVRSDQLLWKEPGLRLLDIDEDEVQELNVDEELGAPPSDKAEETMSVGRATDSSVSFSEGFTQPLSSQVDVRLSWPLQSAEKMMRAEEHYPLVNPLKRGFVGTDNAVKKVAKQSILPFSATESLASFLDLRGHKFKKCASSYIQPDGPKEASSDPIHVSQATGFGSSETADVEVPSTPKSIELFSHMPAPRSYGLQEPCTIVADEKLVRYRALVSMLDEHSDGNLTTIYRDLEGSADLILNPTTCVIITNAQALTQRNLPGQKSGSGEGALQSRINNVRSAFDTVFVLINIPSTVSGQQLRVMLSVGATFTSCTGLCQDATGANGKMRLMWVPNGGLRSETATTPLCSWAWSLICRYAFRDCQVCSADHSRRHAVPLHLIQDVSVWELFLRQCGMNAMAAQVVLAMLKKTDTGDGMADEVFGLRQLICMPQDERVTRFGGIIGERSLSRLSEALL